MGIPVDFLVVQGFSYGPDDISFGDGESLEVPVNGGASGTIDTVPLVKRQMTLTLKGATDSDVAELEALRANNIVGLLNRNIETEDINVGGYLVEQAYLSKVTPSGPQIVNSRTVFNSVELIYNSRVYS